MKDLLENDRRFKEAIGEFIIAFSQLEFGLAFLCVLTEPDLKGNEDYLSKYLGFPLDKKLKHLNKYIKNDLFEIHSVWEKIQTQIIILNKERRFLVHGFMSYSLPREHLVTFTKVKGKIEMKNQTLVQIKEFTNKVQHLNTGKNGINGEFNILFTKIRIDKWNDSVLEIDKIVYRVNSVILSKWTGNPS